MTSNWAVAHLWFCQMRKLQYDLGRRFVISNITYGKCLEQYNTFPVFEEVTLYIDQHHEDCVLPGGSGHSGSMKQRQYWIAVNPETGKLTPLSKGGVQPLKCLPVVAKYQKQAKGTFRCATPVFDGKK